MSRSWAGGSTRRWRKVREFVLVRDGYTCRVDKGGRPCGAHATHVDHIVPLADGGDKWDPANMRAACAPCNLSRGTQATRAAGTAPVHVLIGPPAGGKTSRVHELVQPRDVVIDLDMIAAAIAGTTYTPGGTSHDYPAHVRNVAIGARAAAIRRAVTITTPGVEVWLIHAIPSVEQVRQYVSDGWDVQVIDPGAEVVRERIRNSDRGTRHLDAANTWYARKELILDALEPVKEWTW